ncbi:MAG: flagellar basal-body MS-ring/collar protein FliF [Myxococcales bacterium]|nr:flagellar basal-body MS-ring/collar protein FliF [Myxococcota bacterium]MDW8282823.1 flagellar basal-body MS-ring/collar protein FliF [Myxococcales bacterium]
MADLGTLPRQLRSHWQALQPQAKRAIATALILTVAGLAVLAWRTGRVEYGLLFTNLTSEDAAAIIERLTEQRVPYRLSRGGEAIEVPHDRVAEMRLALAAQGLPRGGGVGFEILEKQPLGVSEFNQRAQYLRALQGELERSILTIDAVQRARVHLVVPERQLFRTAEQQASASVMLQLRPGRQLLPRQVQGIVHLVASSVEGLQPERVTVVDQRGEVLSHTSSTEAATSQALAFQREIEHTSARRAQELLERTVGRGHVAVQVSAQIDASQFERTDESFNPEQQVVRSEQEIDDIVGATGDNQSEGVAGARANLPGGPPPQVSAGAGSHRRTHTRNFEIGRTTSKIIRPTARLERLTVAVLVDGTYKGEGQARQFVPRGKEELEAYAAIVKEAVGFDARRGDQIEVRCVPFAPTDEAIEMSAAKPTTPPWVHVALAAAVLLAAMMLLRWRRSRVQVLPPGVRLPTSVGQLEATLGGDPALPAGPADLSAGPSPQTALLQALEAMKRHPDRAAHVLRAWLNETSEEEKKLVEAHRT